MRRPPNAPIQCRKTAPFVPGRSGGLLAQLALSGGRRLTGSFRNGNCKIDGDPRNGEGQAQSAPAGLSHRDTDRRPPKGAEKNRYAQASEKPC